MKLNILFDYVQRFSTMGFDVQRSIEKNKLSVLQCFDGQDNIQGV